MSETYAVGEAGRPQTDGENLRQRSRRARRAALCWGLVALVLYVGFIAYSILHRR